MVYMRKKTHLIVGYGEVGKAIHKVLGKALIADSKGGSWRGENVDVLHICFPYSRNFEEAVKQWSMVARLTIVHSTVQLGFCDRLQVVHSPIRGVHPQLEKGIRTFVKYFGGKNSKKAARIFREFGIKTRSFPEAKTTEALKLWDTTQYGRLIMLQKEIYAWCEKNNVDFESVYIDANKDYNKGYIKLGRPEVVRPYLKYMPGTIGGHCVLPNAKLLGVKI